METTLLLVDPHVVLREGLRALVAGREDLSVVGEASTGAEALETSKRYRPDIVILETHLPGMSGLEVIGQLSQDAEGPKVLVLSMHDSQIHVEQALRAGAQGYMVKTGSAKELIHAGSEEEVQLRSATVQAVEMLCAATRAAMRDGGAAEGDATLRQVTPVQLDWLLWQRGEALHESGELPAHHRTLTVYY